MSDSHQRISWRWVRFVVLLAVAGCGPAKTEVSGTVRYQGKPLTSGDVLDVLVVDADGMTYSAPIRSEGSYLVREVPVGPVRFVVQASDKPDTAIKFRKREGSERRGQTDLINNKRGDSRTPAKSLLPRRYASPTTSGLSTTLKPGPNTFDLDLE